MAKFYKKWQFFAFVIPLFVFYTMFTVVPVFTDIIYSLTNWHGVETPDFIGLSNYAKVFHDKYLLIALKNTLIVAVVSVILVLPVSFFCAYTLNRQTRLNNTIKTIIFSPYVISFALTALIWSFVLNPTSGLLNGFLESVGLGAFKQKWINGDVLSPYSFAVVETWAGIGFYISLWQVGLRGISSDILEASLLDGVTKWQQVRYVIIPLLKSTTTTILIFILTGALKIYEIVYILTGGGPVRRSESIVSYMYTVMFTNCQYGYAMAIAVVEFVLAVVVTVLIRGISRNKKD